MKLAKGLALFSVILLVLAALPACTNDGGGHGDVLRVGTEATFPPFESRDDDDNFIGFDIDIINYIAEDNGWEIEIVDIDFTLLVDSLASGHLDIVIAAMTIDEDRSKKVLFSDPYYDASQIIVVRDDETREFDLEDIADMNLVVGVQMGTTGAMEADNILGEEKINNLKEYRRANEAFLELKNGRVDLVIIDEPVAKKYIQQMGGMKLHGDRFTDEKFGIAVQLGNTELMDKINASLAKLVSSGEYDVLYDKWFEEIE